MNRSITIQGDNGIESFDCPETEYILDAAEDAGIALPYSAGLERVVPVQQRSLLVRSTRAINHFLMMIKSKLATCFCVWPIRKQTLSSSLASRKSCTELGLTSEKTIDYRCLTAFSG